MEKTIFLFRRHAARDRADFGRHYVRNHAPLGARLTRCLRGYTVNIVESEGPPDAITEHWLDAADDLFDPAVAYATREDLQMVIDDDRTLFSGSDIYVAGAETYPVPGTTPDGTLGEQTPGCKLVWLYPSADDVPPPPAAATRVVDNHVVRKLVYTETGKQSVPPDIQLIRMAWGSDPEDFGNAMDGAIVTREHRFVEAPTWPSA